MSKNNPDSSKGRFMVGKKIILVVFLCVFFLFLHKAQATPNSDSMLGYWKLDGNCSDSGGHGATCLLGGTSIPNYSTSAPSMAFSDAQSLHFNGDNSYLTFANQAELQPITALSFSLWINLDSIPSANSVIGGNYTTSYNNGFFFQIDPVSVSFTVGNGTTTGTASFPVSGISANTWVHLTGTWNGSTIKIYKNGTVQNSVNYTTPAAYSSSEFKVGHFAGKMDDIRLYKRALSQTEITDLASGHHTSAAWVGGGTGDGADYENVNNWDIGVVPDPYTLVTINSNISNQPKLTADESLAGLTINSGADFDLQSRNLTFHEPGTFSNDGTLILQNLNTQTLTGFTNDTDSGTIEINAPSGVTGLKTGYAYNNLTINTTTSITLTLGNNLTVNGNLALENGVLDVSANNYGVTIKGNWTSAGGSFAPRSGTVYLTGTNQNISGSNTFYNLSKSVSSADTLTFEAGSTQTITHNLSFQGAAPQFLSLRSSVSSTQWNIDPQGNRDVSSLNIKDSKNINSVAIALPGRNVNSGNNTNWTFDTTPPAIILNSTSITSSDNKPPINGSATELTATVSSVEYQIDGSSGSWTACTATDGTYNNSTESFSCTPASSLSEGTHVMYVRATDTNGNTTTSGNYSSIAVTIDKTAPILAEVTKVAVLTTSISPAYTFTTDESGSISYAGSCTSATSSATVGNNTINFVSLSDGTHSDCSITVTDAAGNASNALQVTAFSVDATTPAISFLSHNSHSNSADISWTTNESSSTQVEYGKTTNYGYSTSLADSAVMATSHTATLPSLDSCTTYHYQVESADIAGNVGRSADDSFTTDGCPACEDGEPGKPDLKKATTEDADSIKRYFDDASGTVNHYSLKYGIKSGSYEWEVNDIGDKGDGSYTVKSLSPGTTYYFRIRAVNSCAKGNWSDEVSAKTDAAAASDNTDAAPSAETKTETLPAAAALETKNANPAPDYNGLTSETWQSKYFGSPYCYDENRCGGQADPDNDGMTNNDEFRFNTDPLRPDSDSDGSIDSAEIESGHDPTQSSQTSGQDQITYEDPREDTGEVRKDEYEVKNVEMVEEGGKKKLKISGQGLPNSFITLYVFSNPIILTVKTDNVGNWSYTLDNDLDDGVHEVYVAVTDNTGKIAVKSEPVTFVKTAEAVSVVPPSEAAAAAKAVSPTKVWYKKDMVIFVAIAAFGLALALISLGFYLHKDANKKEENNIIN